MQQRQAAQQVVHRVETTSAKIRALARAGYDRPEIATFLGVRYQHVRKVMLDAGLTEGLRRPRATNNGSSRKRERPMSIPTPEEFRSGYRAFRDKERRDAMYKTATFLVKHFWGKPAEIADGLGVLLLTSNNAHYRYGSFDFQLLEEAITSNQQLLESFRNRDISTYLPADDASITALFNAMLEALRICEGKKKGTGSPVAVAKALHLLAPAYFPLWDHEIAKAQCFSRFMSRPHLLLLLSDESPPYTGNMATHGRFPSAVDVIVIGAGFAGASVAAALAQSSVTSGVVLEREAVPGSHASGRNAAMARQLEADPVLLKLAIEGVRKLREKEVAGCPVLRQTGGLYLIHGEPDRAAGWLTQLRQHGVPSELLPAAQARQRFPFLSRFEFDYTLFCPTDGIVDIHALLSDLLAEARYAGFEVLTDCACESLIVDGSAVWGVRTPRGEIRARIVVDATGAWAGYLGRESAPLPLKRLRRHLFVSGDSELLPRDAPLVWDLDAGYYMRPEGAGLLLCPCDETEHPPGIPEVDPEAEDLLVDKLLKHAPGLANITLRRSWSCLRTFAPDRLPVIGWDPKIDGLFHVSGLGGFGVTTSLAVGDIASTLICGGVVDWIEAGTFSARREALSSLRGATMNQ